MEEYILAAFLNSLRRRYRMYFRDTSNPFEIHNKLFLKLFRFPKEGVIHLIQLLDDPRLNSGDIPKHIKVLTALQFFGQGSYQTAVGRDSLLALSQPTVSRVITTVANLIVSKLASQYVKFPTTMAEKESAKALFQELFQIPNTLGAVDGTHVAVAKPKWNNPSAPGSLFYNRKGFYSINCQIACSASGKIIAVTANFPGSTHDSAVWGASRLCEKLKLDYVHGNTNQWVLGDKGYPLQPWLMTPVMAPGNAAEEAYNRCHTRARNIIELVFGRLKNKFRCLHRHRCLHYEPVKAGKIILACCVLYNMFINTITDEVSIQNLRSPEDNYEEQDHSSINNYLSQARQIRQNLINTFIIQ